MQKWQEASGRHPQIDPQIHAAARESSVLVDGLGHRGGHRALQLLQLQALCNSDAHMKHLVMNICHQRDGKHYLGSVNATSEAALS